MAKNSIFVIEEDEIFIDESGKTSLEPEGLGHHVGWYHNPMVIPEWEPLENRPDAQPDKSPYPESPDRGLAPVEGDGAGAPS
jgi:hypothetical protein